MKPLPATYFSFISWALLLSSCTEITFTQPQPSDATPLKEIPASLVGSYLTRDPKTGELGDTIVVESWGYRLKDKDEKDWLQHGVISDSLVVKYSDNYYFVNFRTKTNHWILRLIHPTANGSIELFRINLDDEKKRKEILKKLGSLTNYRLINANGDKFYQTNPSVKQLKSMIHGGLFELWAVGIKLKK